MDLSLGFMFCSFDLYFHIYTFLLRMNTTEQVRLNQWPLIQVMPGQRSDNEERLANRVCQCEQRKEGVTVPEMADATD